MSAFRTPSGTSGIKCDENLSSCRQSPHMAPCHIPRPKYVPRRHWVRLHGENHTASGVTEAVETDGARHAALHAAALVCQPDSVSQIRSARLGVIACCLLLIAYCLKTLHPVL